MISQHEEKTVILTFLRDGAPVEGNSVSPNPSPVSGNPDPSKMEDATSGPGRHAGAASMASKWTRSGSWIRPMSAKGPGAVVTLGLVAVGLLKQSKVFTFY